MTDLYLTSTKNVGQFFQAVRDGQAPEKFTNKFLEQLGFTSTNERLFIKMLKELDFIDANGAPQELYFRFLDPAQSKFILADAIRKAYSELFQINTKVNEWSPTEIRNKLKVIFQGKKNDDILTRMANTFKVLCENADFSIVEVVKKPEEKKTKENPRRDPFSADLFGNGELTPLVSKKITTQMHYNIQIHLPETRDIEVYDAIFKSLKEHLL